MANATPAPSIRQFLLALKHGTRAGDIPAELTRLSKVVSRRLPFGDSATAAQDLLAELLARLVSPTLDGRVDCDDLLALDDEALLGALRVRLRQAGARLVPDWRRSRSLRGHVRLALHRGLTRDASALPSSLLSRGAFSQVRVAEAAGWLVHRRGVAPSLRALVGELKRRYATEARQVDLDVGVTATAAESCGDSATLRLEAAALRRRLVSQVAPRDLSLVLERRAGRRLVDLAASANVAVSTLHQRLSVVLGQLRLLVRRAEASPEALSRALDLLEDGGGK